LRADTAAHAGTDGGVGEDEAEDGAPAPEEEADDDWNNGVGDVDVLATEAILLCTS